MDVLTALKERRSINFFDSEKKVSEQTISELLEIANLSPSSFNLQPWEVVVVCDPERKKVLRRCASNQEKVEEASAVFIVISNPEGPEENIDRVLQSMVDLGYSKKEKADKMKEPVLKNYGETDSEKRRIFAVKNTCFFAMSVMTAARGLGLETHPMDGFDTDKVKKEFNIPQNRVLPLLIAVGYPKPGLKLLPRAFRRQLKDFVKYDNYN
jgi:putative NAD(P)H nitroreductase